MDTATKTTATKTTRPADTCRLTVHIRGTAYALKPIPAECHGPGARAWSLRKSGTPADLAYHVAETEHGPTCDCGDATFRDRLCKHAKALQALGLIAAPKTAATPAPVPVPASTHDQRDPYTGLNLWRWSKERGVVAWFEAHGRTAGYGSKLMGWTPGMVADALRAYRDANR